MSTITMSWGDEIQPGDKPTFMFPIVANYTNLETRSDDLLSPDTTWWSGFVGGLGPYGLIPDPIVMSGASLIGEALTQVGLAGWGATGRMVGGPQETAVGGQLGNLNVKTSLNGKALKAGVGILAEISNGIYSYKLDSSETQEPGSLLIIISPSNPSAITDSFICSTYLNCRITKPGIPLARVTKESLTEAFTGGTNPGVSPLQQFEQYVNQVVNNILGNQMATKPTFRKD